MFVHSTSLPHLLAPEAYFSPDHYEREKQTVFAAAWHLVGAWDQLRRNGDFLTVDLLGHPLQIRNCDGRLEALSNLCARRHCLLTRERHGNSPRPRETRPATYRAEACGQLIFVSLTPQGESLQDFLGPLFELCQQRFGAHWSAFLTYDADYAVNWKIPIENSLEAYHVPCIHAKTFGEDPGDSRSQHLLGERHTAFGTSLPFDAHSRIDAWFQSGEAWFLRRLGLEPTGQYWQHHLFPNLLMSFTDAVSLCHAVIPTSPTTSRGIVRQFGRNGLGTHLGTRLLAAGWGRLAAGITRRILTEDQALYKDIQRGLESSRHGGILGRCEERIYRFQQYVQQASDMRSAAAASDNGQPEGSVP